MSMGSVQLSKRLKPSRLSALGTSNASLDELATQNLLGGMSERAVGKLNTQWSAMPLSSDLSFSPISHFEQLLLTQFAWVAPLPLGVSVSLIVFSAPKLILRDQPPTLCVDA